METTQAKEDEILVLDRLGCKLPHLLDHVLKRHLGKFFSTQPLDTNRLRGAFQNLKGRWDTFRNDAI